MADSAAPSLDDLPKNWAHMVLVAQVRDCAVEGDCWLWMGARDRKTRYGCLTANSQQMKSHRAFYEYLVGPIPDGLQLDHLCRIPSCCNPLHLEPVTGLENVRRGMRATKTHCKRGHELAGDNLYVFVSKKGTHRTCRKCRDASRRKAQYAAAERKRKTWSKYLPGDTPASTSSQSESEIPA